MLYIWFCLFRCVVEKNKVKSKIIISGTQHVHNELAKLWILKQKHEFNKKLFIVSHGGGHQYLSLTMYDYEHKLVIIFSMVR